MKRRPDRTKRSKASPRLSPKLEKALTSIAGWQFLVFLMLILLVWINEFNNIAARVFDLTPSTSDYFGGAILSAFVIIAGIITVGHTYVQQKKILSGFIVICSRCHKVKIEADVWQQIETFVSSQSDATFSHGLCPECFEKDVRDLNQQSDAPVPT